MDAMTFTFLHTADWQIGKAFGGLPADVAAALREARLSAIDRLAEVARAGGARHILVAGDVFDAETLAPKTVRQAVARMETHAEMTWHLLPGNHDPHRKGGLWERLVRDGLPANIRPIMTPQAIEIEPRIWLLPAPLTGRATASDPTLYMDNAETPAGAVRIGLAHGSVRFFGSDQAASVGLSPTRAASAGLDYLALGDWHGAQQVAPKTWYSGTPEPDRFMDNDPGFALLVEVNAGAEPRIQRIATAQFAWIKRTVDVSRLNQKERILNVSQLNLAERALNVAHDPVIVAHDPVTAASNPLLHNTLLQLTLRGRVTPERRQNILNELRAIEARHRHLDADLSELKLTSGSGGLEQLEGTGDLKHVAERLLARATDPAAPDAATATEALAMLLDLATETGDARP